MDPYAFFLKAVVYLLTSSNHTVEAKDRNESNVSSHG